MASNQRDFRKDKAKSVKTRTVCGVNGGINYVLEQEDNFGILLNLRRYAWLCEKSQLRLKGGDEPMD